MQRTATLLLLLAGCGEETVGTMRGDDAGAADALVPADAAADASPAVDAPPPDAFVDPCPRVRVTTVGEQLNVRSEPTVASEIVTTFEPGTIVTVLAVAEGEEIDGVRTWYEVDTTVLSGWITGRFAECTTEEATFRAFDGFRLPLECGTTVRISQGNNTTFSHQGLSAYAFDFSIGVGTSLHAMADGVVSFVQAETMPGEPCYDGGGVECVAAANIVKLRHADGTVTSYAHLSSVPVSLGESVRAGTVVGLSGSSGWSTGPHAHVAREDPVCGSEGCQSIPLVFLDVEGDGVPETDEHVTSGNCP